VTEEEQSDERLRKLERAFREGRISEETYAELKSKYSACARVLGLVDPNHPARREIDEASALADEVVELFVSGGVSMVTCDSIGAMRLVSAIDKALEKASSDLDLMVAKSAALCLAAQFKTAEEIIDRVLSLDPNHFEARQRKDHWERWRHLFHYPPWSEGASTLHPIIIENLRHERSIQIVRDGLQLGVAVFRPALPSHFPKGLSPAMRCKWETVLSETPYGPILAHYILIEDDPVNPFRAEGFIPALRPKEVNPMSSYWLMHRLLAMPSCFIVITNGQRVLYNKRYVFPETLRTKLKSILDKFASEPKERGIEAFRKAAKWHMEHFDMKTIRF